MNTFRNEHLLNHRSWFLWYLPVFLGPIILLSEALFAEKVLFWGTPALQFIPWRLLAWRMLQSGEIPLWNPLNGMGSPLLANYQLALFYPPGWIIYLFAAIGGDTWLVWSHSLLIAIHLIWAGVGVGLLSRNLGINYPGQILAALAFCMSGYFVARIGFFSMIWAGAWLPWSVLASKKIMLIDRQKRSQWLASMVWTTLCFSFQLLAGHAQLTWYSLLLCFAWIIYETINRGQWGKAVRSILDLSFSWLLAAGISGVQIIPTFEYLIQSQRASAVDYELAMSYSFWPWRFLTFFVPDIFGNPGRGDYWGYGNYWEDAIYIGVIPLILSLTTITKIFDKSEKSIKFLWLIIMGGSLFALGKNTPIYPLLFKYVPSFSMFHAPARFMIIPLLGLSLLSGIGLTHWKKPTGRKLYWFRLGIAGALAVMIACWIGPIFISEISQTFINGTLRFGFMTFLSGIILVNCPIDMRVAILSPNNDHFFIKKQAWYLVLIGFLFYDLILYGCQLIPTTDYSIYNGELYQIPGKREGGTRIYIYPKDEYYLKYTKYFNFQSFNTFENWSEIRKSFLPNINIIDQVASANNFEPILPNRYNKWMEKLGSTRPDHRLPWLRLMGVGTTVEYDKTLNKIEYEPIIGSEKYWWSSCALFVKNEEEAWREMVSDNLRDGDELAFPDHIVIEDDQKISKFEPCIKKTGYDVKISIISTKATAIIFEVDSPSNGWLLISDTFFPGWHAKIDNHATKLYRANYLFRGIEIKKGHHLINIYYSPESFNVGIIISIISIIILSSMIYFYYKRV